MQPVFSVVRGRRGETTDRDLSKSGSDRYEEKLVHHEGSAAAGQADTAAVNLCPWRFPRTTGMKPSAAHRPCAEQEARPETSEGPSSLNSPVI